MGAVLKDISSSDESRVESKEVVKEKTAWTSWRFIKKHILKPTNI
jgi:hypothetical protein